MNKKLRKLIKDPKAYFYDYFRKQIRNNPKGTVSIVIRLTFANAKTDLGYGKEIRRYLKEGNLDFAERICLEGMSVVPKAIRPYVLYAEISMRRGGEGYFKEAIRRWKTVAEKFPNKPEGYAGEERAYVALGDFEHAEVLCKNSIKNMPQELWSYIELAELSMRQGDFSEALRRWDTVREKFPDKVPGYVRASVACCSLEKFSEAEELCRECMRVAPEDYRPYAEYAEVSLRQRDFDEGLKRCQTVRERFPGRADGYVRAAWAYMEMLEYAKAEDFCRQSMEAAPKDIRSFSEYAEISVRQKDFITAVERWNTVRETFPREPAGYIRGANTLCQIKDFSKAEELCRNYMEIVPSDISSFIEYAEISMRKSNYKDAANRWEIVCDKFPGNVHGYIGWGRALLELHEYLKAEEACKKGLNKAGKNPGERRNLYYCLIDIVLKQRSRAKDCIRLFHDIEQTYTKTIKEDRYFTKLASVLIQMIGRDKEAVDSSTTDFILERLLNEPLDYSSSKLRIITLLSGPSLVRYPEELENLKEHLQVFLPKISTKTPMSILLSDKSSDDDKLNAHLNIIRNSCYHSVDLCTNPENKLILERACDLIVDNDEWKSLNPHMLFNFARSFLFANQDKGDNFISKVYSLYKDNNVPVSEPIGLLCFRHKKRQEISEAVSRQYVTKHDKNKKLKIAVCIGGQLRGYKGNLKSLVDSIGLCEHSYRVFVHTWAKVGRHFPVPYRSTRSFTGEFSKTYYECFVNKGNLEEYIKKQFPEFYSLIITSSQATLEVLSKEYNTSDIVIDNEDYAPFSSWSNQEKMHYKIYAAHQLAVKSGEKFDLVIRIRPDLMRECEDTVDLYDIYNKSRSNVSIFTTSGLGTSSGLNYSIDDNFAIGIPETMGVYANTYQDYTWHLQHSTFSRTKQFSGHITLEHNLFCMGVHIDKFHQKITGAFRDPEKISSKDVFDALSKDVKSRTITAEDKHLLDACKIDMASLEKE